MSRQFLEDLSFSRRTPIPAVGASFRHLNITERELSHWLDEDDSPLYSCSSLVIDAGRLAPVAEDHSLEKVKHLTINLYGPCLQEDDDFQLAELHHVQAEYFHQIIQPFLQLRCPVVDVWSPRAPLSYTI